MAKLTIGQKAQRVLKLLLGLRNRRVAEALAAYGFGQSDLDEGWSLLRALTDDRLTPRSQPTDPTLLQRLDDWENQWFPVASASLGRRFPEAQAFVFANLTQTKGAEVIVSVGTFVDRIGRLTEEPTFGAAGREARELLAQRGLTAEVVGAAEQMLRALGSTEPALPPSDEEAIAAREDALWRWYLEWAEIVRVAVKDRRLLRELGFLFTRPSAGSDDGEPEEGAVAAG